MCGESIEKIKTFSSRQQLVVSGQELAASGKKGEENGTGLGKATQKFIGE